MRRALFFALANALPAAQAPLGANTTGLPAPQAPQVSVQPMQTPVITITQHLALVLPA